MAIALEFVNVIVPIEAVEARYPGGVEAYFNDCPNNSYLQDEHLTRVGFMSTADARGFLNELDEKGLRLTEEGREDDVAVLWSGMTEAARCDWVEVGEHEGCSACWLKGRPAGVLVEPREARMYRCPRAALEGLPRLLEAAGYAVLIPDPSAPDRLVCRRDGRRVVLEINSTGGEEGFLFLFSDCGRIAGAPDDSDLIRDLDELLTRNGASRLVREK